jgi:hypothetical protein
MFVSMLQNNESVKFLNLILTLISVDLNVIVSKPKNIHDDLYFIFVK